MSNGKFKGWDICECIGEGTYGKVYRIHREDFGHEYNAALKVISIPSDSATLKWIVRETGSEERTREYFRWAADKLLGEIDLMDRLKGFTNIVSYEDHAIYEKKDTIGYTILIRMELLTSLYDHIDSKNGYLDTNEVIKLGIDISRALELCEKNNIIHRDIKPGNIYVSSMGEFKLGDFGVARVLEGIQSDLSKKGTIGYMAPEVFKGLPYDKTADIYSLGMVLYMLLNNNRMPFLPQPPESFSLSDREQAAEYILHGISFPKPANASSELTEVILKACQYVPGERYKNGYEFRKALERVAGLSKKDAVSSREITEPSYIPKEKTNIFFAAGLSGKKKIRIALMESVFVLIAAIGVGLIIYNKVDGYYERENVQTSDVIPIQTNYPEESQIPKPTPESSEVPTSIPVQVAEKKIIPDLRGMPIKKATKSLDDIGIKVKKEYEYNSTIKKGVVVSQSIPAGESVSHDKRIVLVVSKGAKPTPIPPTQKPEITDEPGNTSAPHSTPDPTKDPDFDFEI